MRAHAHPTIVPTPCCPHLPTAAAYLRLAAEGEIALTIPAFPLMGVGTFTEPPLPCEAERPNGRGLLSALRSLAMRDSAATRRRPRALARRP